MAMQNKRLSVAGPAAHGIYAPTGLAPPSVNPRQSLYRLQNLNPLLEYDISMQTLANIMGKEYRNIVQYLFSMLDPGYSFNPQACFEDEFIQALKCIWYPFVGQVDPKWLAAPVSMHSWPQLLGVLHWLIVMCKVRHEHLASAQGFLPLTYIGKATLHGEQTSHITVLWHHSRGIQ